jgi:Domain of unknown function (DUF4388)
MPYQRETATDRLSNVIQVIQLGRKSGLLTVERGTGSTFEEGTITFVNGEATDAQVGKYTAKEAFYWLNSWGPSRFAFIPAAPAERPSTARSAITGKLSDTTARLPAQMPVRRGQLQPTKYRSEGGAVSRLREHSPARPEIWAVPYRTRQVEEALHLIDQMGLSRVHWRLFLLIDGYRSTQELVRLLGREQGEVQRLLNDLEQAGVIQL